MASLTNNPSINQLIDRAAHTMPDRTFLISPESHRVLTFLELQQESVLVSLLLSQQGLQPQDKVAFVMDNGLLTTQLFLGAMYGGFVAVPLNVRSGRLQLSYVLDHCDAKVVFVEEQYRLAVQEAMSDVHRPVEIIPVDADGTIADLFTTSGEAPLTVPVADDVALLMYSSGSTGQPKAAVHTHRSILAHGENAALAHELSPADRSLLVLPLYHINAECVTLMPTLLTGGSVVVPHRFSVSQFWDWIDDYRCTWSALVPTIISELVNWDDPKKELRGPAFQRIRFFRSSSAPLSPSLHREFQDKFDLPLLQAMGSTEGGNVFSNPQPPRANKIGSPGLPWGFEARIVDRDGQDLAAGVSGEVLLRGPALMRAYYKDPEGTAAVVDRDGWLHTGDLAYRDEDGYFFVVGRSKELVIKGGVNIAPRQIDDVLESHPAVLEAAAVGVPDRYLGEDLVAFVVLRPGADATENELLSFCEEHLGHFKTPTWIGFAGDLPKGPSGKVQRLKLLDAAVAEMEVRTKGVSQFPASEIEQTITEVWAELLGVPHVDPEINFFALGGHSLLAIQCLSRLRDKLPYTLTLSDFFENSTVARQAALIRQRIHLNTSPSAPRAQTAIPRRDPSMPCPLSPGQQRIWYLDELNPGVPVYNEAEAVRLRGTLDVDALEQAFNTIVTRHEVLRTTIQVVDGTPCAVVHESWPLRIKKIDLSTLPASEREAEMRRLLTDEPRAPYRLQEEPAIRVTLLRLASQDHLLILMMHHIIADWSSEGVLWRELSTLYRALTRGIAAALPALPIQHGDYAAWQQQLDPASFGEDLAYWEETLGGAPPLLELPADRPRPPVESHRGARMVWTLNRALTEALRDTSRRENASLFSILAAALNTLLYRYTGSDDILLGIPLADRDRPELANVIGFLLHVQVLRTRVSADLAFRDLLARTQKGVLDLYAHRSVPFDQVVRRMQPQRNPGYSSLFQVMLNWRDRDQQLAFIGLEGLEVESVVAESGTSKFDLLLFATDTAQAIDLELEYSTDLFDETRIRRMLGHFETLLSAVAGDPGRCLAELPLLTDDERREQLFDRNQTGACWPGEQYLDELIEDQAQRSPDAVAVVFEDTRMTYRELNDRADRLAGHLRALGLRHGCLAGISVERSADMLVGLLGILKAGGAYVPLDPTYPRDRLAFIIEDSQPQVLVTQSSVKNNVSFYTGPVVELDSVDWQVAESEPGDIVRQAEDVAYVLYTSGSTGKPKGVQVPHRALMNLLRSMQREPGITAQDTLLAVTTLSFDIAGLELYLPLISGARVVIASTEALSDGSRLAALMRECGATVMQATPATWRLLLDSGWSGDPGLKILCGGEAWPADLAEQLLPRCHSLWNMYGPTETTIWSSAARVERGQPVLIGAPIANTIFYILDGRRQPVPVGLPGELYIGGDGVALGYWNRPELTTARFLDDPFRGTPGARMFQTGDLVRYRPGGGIEFLHRVDQQVKIRGFRVELGEIEACLKRHAGVGQCVVVVHEDARGDKTLAAFVVPSDSKRIPQIPQLRDSLQHDLPNYMIPAAFSIVDRLPLTPNGKIDRRALALVDHRTSSVPVPESAAPCTTLELQVAQIWERFLGTQLSSVHQSFFHLGGHSLLAVRLISEVNTVFHAGLTIPAFLQSPTVAGMAKLLERESSTIREPRLIPLRPGTQPGTVFFLGSGVGICRLGLALEGPSIFATVVPFAVSAERAASLNGSDTPPGLQEMASVFVRLIRSSLDGGPCVLVGHSFTGLLAFEIAHQLMAEGRAVEMIVLLDAWARSPRWWWKMKTISPARLRSKLSRLLAGMPIFRDAAPGDLAGPVEAPYQSLDEMSWGTFQHVTRTALREYRLRPLESRAVLFRATESHRAHFHAFDPNLGWTGLFSGGIANIAMPGGHSTMLLEANLPGLAKRFQEHLNSVLAEAQPGAEQNSSSELSIAAGA